MTKKNDLHETTSSLQITKIVISDKDEVTIEAREKVLIYPNGTDGEGAIEHFNSHSITSDFGPTKEFMEEFQKLKRFAMSMAEFDRKSMPLVNQMRVGEMRIAGRQEDENSRVEFVLMKYIKRTSKSIPIKTGQAIMYGEKGKMDIPETVDMTKQIDVVIKKAWEFVNGDNVCGTKIQLVFKKAS